MNEALINAIRESRDVVTWGDIVKAKQLKDLGPPEDVEYIERERHATALHEACHAVVAYRVRHHLVIDIATIEKGGNYLGMVSSIPPEDLFTRWRSDYEADVMVSLASLAGEKMFFAGDSSSGVSGDLESATQLATFMEGYWGMGQTISSHGVTHRVGVGGGGRPGKPEEEKDRELLKAGARRPHRGEARRSSSSAPRSSSHENRVQVLAVTHALESHKTLTGEDIEAVIEGEQGPLIDGRVYGTPEFEGIAEAYHAEVLDAHGRHGKVEVPLPKLNGHRGDVGPLAPLAPRGSAGNGGGNGADRPQRSRNPPPEPTRQALARRLPSYRVPRSWGDSAAERRGHAQDLGSASAVSGRRGARDGGIGHRAWLQPRRRRPRSPGRSAGAVARSSASRGAASGVTLRATAAHRGAVPPGQRRSGAPSGQAIVSRTRWRVRVPRRRSTPSQADRRARAPSAARRPPLGRSRGVRTTIELRCRARPRVRTSVDVERRRGPVEQQLVPARVAWPVTVVRRRGPIAEVGLGRCRGGRDRTRRRASPSVGDRERYLHARHAIGPPRRRCTR